MNLSTRIIVLIAIVTMLIGTLSVILSRSLVEQGYEDINHDWANALVSSLAEGVANDVINGEYTGVRQVLVRALSQSKVLEYAYVTDFDGRIVVHTFSNGFPKKLVDLLAGISDQSGDEVIDIDGVRLDDVRYPIIEGMRARLHLGISHEQETALIGDLTQDIMLATMVIGLSAIILAFPMSRQISRPLEKLGLLMQQFGSGELKGRFDIPQDSLEVIQLGQAFNQMIQARNEAEEQLRTSQEQLGLLLDSTGEGVYGVDINGDCTFANPACVELVGAASAQALLGRNMHAFMHHSYADGSVYPVEDCQIHKAHIRGQHISADDEVFWCVDGSCFPVEYSSYPVIKDEQVVGSVVAFSDITQRKQIEQALKTSEERFQLAVKGSSDGLWDWNILTGDDYFSPRFIELLGYDDDDEFPQVLDSFLSRLHPDESDMVAAAVSNHLEKHVPYRVELRLRKKDGSYGWFLSRGQAIWDADGVAVRMAGSVADISQKIIYEQKLKEKQQTLDKAQQIAHIGSWDWNIKTGNLGWSDEIFRIFGQQPQSFKATYDAFLQTIHPEDRQKVIDAVNESVKGPDTKYDIEHRIIRPDGVVRYVHEQGAVYVDGNGEPEHMVGAVLDITQRKQIEAELADHREHLEELVEERTRALEEARDELVRKERLATLGQLTATVSHELRNPLGAIRPSLFVISKKIDKKDELLRQSIERVERSVDRCDNIIEELLGFTRITKLNRQTVIIDDWLKEVLQEQQILEGVTLKQEFGLAGYKVDIDLNRLRRAVINVVENACHAMYEPGEVGKFKAGACLTVKTQANNGRIEIITKDNGEGIPDDVLAKAFEPLFSTKGFGVGLGLPTVKQILEQHAGGVDVSTRIGEGTSFTLWLAES